MFRFEIAVIAILVVVAVVGISMKKGGKVEVKTMEGMTVSKYYDSLGDKFVRCTLCPHACRLANGETGECRTKKNIDGVLYSLSHGKIVAINNDPIEKKPFFHFLYGSKTYSVGCAGCNLHCNFCQNWSISQASPDDVPYQEMTPAQVVQNAIDSGSLSVAFTYNEPLNFYEFVLETAKLAKENGLKTIMVTNGYINEEPLRELAQFIDAANVDLKGFTDKFYREYTTASLKPVLNSIKVLKEMGVFIEITNLIIPGANDKDEEILALIKWVKENVGVDTPLHFSRFFPAYKLKDRPPTPFETVEKARKMALKEGMRYVYTGNQKSEDGEDTICPHCGKKVVKRNGFLITYENIKNGKCGFCGGEIYGMWDKKLVRKPAVAGMWYPDNKSELTKMLQEIDKKPCPEFKQTGKKIAGLIAPHAGFVYSGATAACGFKQLKNQNYERVVILGSSHRYRADLIAVFDGTESETPLGNLKIDTDFTKLLLASDPAIQHVAQIDEKEHSLEAMFPFIKFYLGSPEIVLVLTSTEDEKTLEKAGVTIANLIKADSKNTLVVASTDMSHYHPYDEAVKIDKFTISVVESGDYAKLKKFVQSKKCELCGHDSLISFFTAMKELKAGKGRLTKYENSGDAVPRSKSEGVVGYMSMVFELNEKIENKKDKKEEKTMGYYNEKERKYLLELARNSISYTLKNKKQLTPEKPTEKKLLEERAVFVTLRIDGELRGCIGSMIATQPLYLAVAGSAHSAAFSDPRFAPLSEEELKQIHIEISVLTPMEKVASWKELKVGTDGVYIKRGYRSGVFLPQVATETGWDLETFLSNLCSHKAGLPADCYKDPDTEIYKYQVELFEE
ncbi:MAG: AmmeMemoRadiSam system radical SAM enzyme [bacterium]